MCLQYSIIFTQTVIVISTTVKPSMVTTDIEEVPSIQIII